MSSGFYAVMRGHGEDATILSTVEYDDEAEEAVARATINESSTFWSNHLSDYTYVRRFDGYEPRDWSSGHIGYLERRNVS